MDDAYNEQRLINEVIFLHGLWHQGPPGRHNSQSFGGAVAPPPPLRSLPQPLQQQALEPHPSLSVTSTTSFKKSRRKKARTPAPETGSAGDSGIDWPSNVVEEKDSGWGEASRVSEIQDMSTENREKFALLGMQHRIVNICNQFFAKGDDDDEDDMDESEDEDGGDHNRECEEYKFFKRLFVENVKFREYYEKSFENGEFCCLVCCRKGNKVIKGCAGLVQHSNTISSKGRRAHRALARVVCEVLGWNYDRLPTIILTGKPLSSSLVNVGESKAEAECNADPDQKDLDAGTSIADIVRGNNGESVVSNVDNPHMTAAEPQTSASASAVGIVKYYNSQTVEREVSNPDQTCADTSVPNIIFEPDKNADSDMKDLGASTSIADIVHGDDGEPVVRKVDNAHETSSEQQTNATASAADNVNYNNSKMIEREVSKPGQTCAENVVPKFSVEAEETADFGNKELDDGDDIAGLVEDDFPELYG